MASKGLLSLLPGLDGGSASERALDGVREEVSTSFHHGRAEEHAGRLSCQHFASAAVHYQAHAVYQRGFHRVSRPLDSCLRPLAPLVSLDWRPRGLRLEVHFPSDLLLSWKRDWAETQV